MELKGLKHVGVFALNTDEKGFMIDLAICKFHFSVEGTKYVVMGVFSKVRGKIQCTAQVNQNFKVLNLILVLLHSYELNLKPQSVEGMKNSPWGGGEWRKYICIVLERVANQMQEELNLSCS